MATMIIFVGFFIIEAKYIDKQFRDQVTKQSYARVKDVTYIVALLFHSYYNLVMPLNTF